MAGGRTVKLRTRLLCDRLWVRVHHFFPGRVFLQSLWFPFQQEKAVIQALGCLDLAPMGNEQTSHAIKGWLIGRPASTSLAPYPSLPLSYSTGEQEENAEVDKSMDTPTSSINTIPAMIPSSRIAEGGAWDPGAAVGLKGESNWSSRPGPSAAHL